MNHQCWGVIPARGGSKGIPRKNLREVNGIPLIAYTIKAALASHCLAGVVVSTDDEEIAQVALEHGAQVPFMRPVELATDSATDLQVITHFSQWLAEQAIPVQSIAYLRPTTPLKTAQLIDEGILKLTQNPQFSGVRSVTKTEGVFHPYWMFAEDEQHRLAPFVEGITLEKYYQRQLLPSCFRLNGVCDLLRIDNLSSGDIYGPNVGFIEIPENQSIDIDTELDLKWLEFLLHQQELK
ncbi:cytidylyltransferase domain-containing protein [Neptunicella sp. SCSIO 80796]|uniref:acylneuraminate cytidylyltransferase family protein n=1 Tax=Neptunicella plasticusilytica TaxID=3117012 RepID=UPI003A4D60F7